MSVNSNRTVMKMEFCTVYQLYYFRKALTMCITQPQGTKYLGMNFQDVHYTSTASGKSVCKECGLTQLF